MVRRTLRVTDEVDLLPALTVLQPFATALVDEDPCSKFCENRTWKREYPEGGLWTAIHAGASRYCRSAEEEKALLDSLTRKTRWPANAQDYPRGAIVGLVRFVACVPVQSRLSDPWAVGPWCHVADKAVRFLVPITGVKGALGFWRLDAETTATLRDLNPMEAR